MRPTDDFPDSGEVFIHAITGSWRRDDPSHQTKVVAETSNLTIAGRYMAVTVLRLFVNIRLQHELSLEVRPFTILGASFHNLWAHRLPICCADIKMIDSDGFQHPGDLCEYISFTAVEFPGRAKPVPASFPWPERELEAGAKTRGWLWFNSLPPGVVPHRFVFRFKVFDAGQISGWVRDSETLEFVLARCQRSQIGCSSRERLDKLLPPPGGQL
jgi:hypothetical protein